MCQYFGWSATDFDSTQARMSGFRPSGIKDVLSLVLAGWHCLTASEQCTTSPRVTASFQTKQMALGKRVFEQLWVVNQLCPFLDWKALLFATSALVIFHLDHAKPCTRGYLKSTQNL